jgi:hypothetical protein
MIFQKKALSDDEYIEQVRKRDRVFRRMRWVWFGLLVALVVVLFCFSHTVQKISAELGEDRGDYSAGLFLGICFGFLFVMISAQAAIALKHWLDSRHGFRTERLLILYHDRVVEMEATTSAKDRDEKEIP